MAYHGAFGTLFDYFELTSTLLWAHFWHMRMILGSLWCRPGCMKVNVQNTLIFPMNLNGFIENRHDQSIFSILCKKKGIKSLSAYECEWGEKNGARTWEHNQDNPILAKRDNRYNFF